MEYTKEQQEDIQERGKKAQEMLKELQMAARASLQWINDGNDNFSTRVTLYLEDEKYREVAPNVEEAKVKEVKK